MSDKIFDRILDKVEKNRQAKQEGRVTSISPPFPRLASKYPGWERGLYYILTASSGVGKSKLAKFLAVTSVFDFYKKHPYLKVKVFYFALEETKEDFWLGIVSSLLNMRYGVNLSPSELKSLGSFTVSEEILSYVRECRDVVNEMETIIDVKDHISNPFGIYKEVRSFFENPEIGEYIRERKEMDGKVEDVVIGYKFKDENFWPFVITDHVSLLTPENGKTLHESMGHFSKEYCLKGFCKRFHCVTINIQQQAAEKEKLEFYQGQTVAQKMEPSLDGLANNKETQRDADVVLGLFAPDRYSLPVHRKYDIGIMRDSYRSLRFLKDRHYGLNGKYVAFYFNGAAGIFEELPPPDEMNYESFLSG